MKAIYQSPQTLCMVITTDCYMMVRTSTNGVGFDPNDNGGTGQVG